VEVWPDCWPAFELMSYVRTQWRTSMSGPSGLDYGVVLQLMEKRGLTVDEQLSLLDDIRVMELAALDEMHKKF